MQNATKVGLLVTLFATLMVAAYVTLGRSFMAPKRVTYRALFEDAGGVSSGNSVLLSGVNVGEVKTVRLSPEGKAEMVLSVAEEVKIPEGSVAILAGSLVGIGDRPVELRPPAKPTGTYLAEGGVIQGSMKGALEGIIPDTSATMAELNETLKATRKLISDTTLKGKFETLLDSTDKTVTEFGLLAGRMNTVIGSNQATLHKTLVDAGAIMKDVSRASSAIADLASNGKMEGKMLAMMDEMTETIKMTQGLLSDVRGKVDDPNLSNSINGILANTKEMTETGTRIAANTEEMTRNGAEISKRAIELADKANQLANELSDLLHKANAAVGEIGKIGKGSTGVGSVGYESRIIRETDPGRFRSEFEAAFKVGTDKYYIGLWDAFESNKLIAQIGRPLGESLELRYGVYASQLGLGVQYRVAPGVWLRGDLFDVNEPRFDLRGRFDMGNGIDAWLGLDRVFSRTSPTIGIGIKR